VNELSYYSGEPIPDLDFSEFSHNTLVELLKLYPRFYMALDGFWYLAIKEKFSNKEALALDLAVWKRVAKYELPRITKLLNIQGDDIGSLIKCIQISPWFRVTKSKIELNGKNNATLTVINCPTLNALEKEGEGREAQICNIVEHQILRDYANFFNPNIEVKCLKSPPRKSKDEICCQWQFILLDDTSSRNKSQLGKSY